jgi:hypothetical protein
MLILLPKYITTPQVQVPVQPWFFGSQYQWLFAPDPTLVGGQFSYTNAPNNFYYMPGVRWAALYASDGTTSKTFNMTVSSVFFFFPAAAPLCTDPVLDSYSCSMLSTFPSPDPPSPQTSPVHPLLHQTNSSSPSGCPLTTSWSRARSTRTLASPRKSRTRPSSISGSLATGRPRASPRPPRPTPAAASSTRI